MANKVRYGLKNVHVASVTVGENNAVTFGTPVRIPGAVSVSIEPSGDTSDFYADDIVYFSSASATGYDVTAEFALLPEFFKTQYLGMQKDDNGVLVEGAGATNNYFAFLFEFTGDENAIRHCLYYCKASTPTIEGETMGDGGAEPQTTEIEFTAMPRPDTRDTKISTGEETATATYNAWYTTVYEPTFATQ